MILSRRIISALLLVAFVALNGCGGGSKEPSKLEQLQQTAKAMEETAKQMEKVQSGEQKPVPPVSFKVLLTFLPKAVGDLKPGEPEGETQNMGEWNFSTAKISFNGDAGKQAEVELFDYAHIGVLYAPYMILLNMKFSRESTKGYEKSIKMGDYPAYEKWENADARNEITVLVGDRFIVSVKTDKLGEGSARKIAEGIDLKKLSVQVAS
jgi:hypothetical protein